MLTRQPTTARLSLSGLYIAAKLDRLDSACFHDDLEEKIVAIKTEICEEFMSLVSLCDSASAILQCVQSGTAYPESIQHMIDDLREAANRAKGGAA